MFPVQKSVGILCKKNYSEMSKCKNPSFFRRVVRKKFNFTFSEDLINK